MLSVGLELLQAIGWCSYYIIEATIKLFIPERFFYKDISGQIVLVTGGGSGIGRLLCKKLARLGARVVTWDINEKGNQETVNIIKDEGYQAWAYTVDMSIKEDIYNTAKKTKECVGTVTILINNAGIVSGSPILETSDERIIKTFEVNSFAHLWTIKSFLPGMLESKLGHIVSVASVAGHGGAAKLVDYCGSKFAAVGIDEAFRVELYTQGHSDYIKTTCVSPYYTNTGMFDGVHSKVLPILEPEYVADRAVAAILTNREILLLPWWGMFLLLLKVILPSRGFMKVAQAFGFNCAMDQFTGRKKTD